MNASIQTDIMPTHLDIEIQNLVDNITHKALYPIYVPSNLIPLINRYIQSLKETNQQCLHYIKFKTRVPSYFLKKFSIYCTQNRAIYPLANKYIESYLEQKKIGRNGKDFEICFLKKIYKNRDLNQTYNELCEAWEDFLNGPAENIYKDDSKVKSKNWNLYEMGLQDLKSKKPYINFYKKDLRIGTNSTILSNNSLSCSNTPEVFFDSQELFYQY